MACSGFFKKALRMMATRPHGGGQRPLFIAPRTYQFALLLRHRWLQLQKIAGFKS
jgi:hypothetical protein